MKRRAFIAGALSAPAVGMLGIPAPRPDPTFVIDLEAGDAEQFLVWNGDKFEWIHSEDIYDA